MQNPILDSGPEAADAAEAAGDVAERIARRSRSKRGDNYADEVRRLLDAGLDVMRSCGTDARPRVADIVAAAGVSNDAFYRHFPSKDALVSAVIEDGAGRLHGYLAHQMAKAPTSEKKVRRWVEGVLAQAADEDVAASTRAVLWNVGSVGGGLASGHSSINAPIATLLREPYAALGSADPELDASLAAHAVMGQLSDYLRRGVRPTRAEIDRVVAFCLAAAPPPSMRR